MSLFCMPHWGYVTCAGSMCSALFLKPSASPPPSLPSPAFSAQWPKRRTTLSPSLGAVGRQCQAKPHWRACRADRAHWSAQACRAAHYLGLLPRGACPSPQHRGLRSRRAACPVGPCLADAPTSPRACRLQSRRPGTTGSAACLGSAVPACPCTREQPRRPAP